MDDPARLILYFAIVVFSCVFHECAHVWVALKQGDPTGRDLGRLTLNPLPHIDLFWTILLPAFSLHATGFPLGGPKPAPVNPRNFRNPRVGDLWCSLAGPASNLLLAGGALLMTWAFFHLAPDFLGHRQIVRDPATGLSSPVWKELSWNSLVLFSIFFINMNLAIVNLIPVPPLDGSRLLHFIVGPSLDPFMQFVDRSGWLTAIPIYFAFRFLAPLALAPFFSALYPGLALLFEKEYALSLLNTYFMR